MLIVLRFCNTIKLWGQEMPKSTELDTTALDNILKNLDSNVADTIAKAGFMVEGRAKTNIVQMGAVDTGALLNSVATSLQSGERSSDAQADALARNPDVEIAPLPIPRDNHTAFVGPQVEYAEAVHFGTHTMPGRPYLLNAVRETEAEFRAMWKDVVTDGR